MKWKTTFTHGHTSVFIIPNEMDSNKFNGINIYGRPKWWWTKKNAKAATATAMRIAEYPKI